MQLEEEGLGFTVQFSLGVGSIFASLADMAKDLWSYGVAVESYFGVSQMVQDASA